MSWSAEMKLLRVMQMISFYVCYIKKKWVKLYQREWVYWKLLLYPEKYLGSVAEVLGESHWRNLNYGDGIGVLVV